jgi:hypothetical protein
MASLFAAAARSTVSSESGSCSWDHYFAGRQSSSPKEEQ